MMAQAMTGRERSTRWLLLALVIVLTWSAHWLRIGLISYSDDYLLL